MRKSIDTSSPKRCVSDAAECSPSRRQKYDASGSVRVKSHGLNRGSALARPHFKSTRHKKIVSFASLSFPSGFEVSCDKSSKGCLLRSDSQRSSESSVLQFEHNLRGNDFIYYDSPWKIYTRMKFVLISNKCICFSNDSK